MAFKLTTSVGQGAKNSNAGDNVWVQMMLNRFIVPGCLRGLKPLATDGLIGTKTIAAIRKFQADIVGFQRPDGRVDPGGATYAALDGPLKWPKNPSRMLKNPFAPVESDTAEDGGDSNGQGGGETKSSRWGLLLLKPYTATDFGIRKFEFELLNVELYRAHRLMLSCTGKCALNLTTLEAVRRWREGGHYIRFNSYWPATFGDFNAAGRVLPREFFHNLAIIKKEGILANVRLFPFIHQKSVPIPTHFPKDPPVRTEESEMIMIGSCRVEYGNGTPSRPAIWYS